MAGTPALLRRVRRGGILALLLGLAGSPALAQGLIERTPDALTVPSFTPPTLAADDRVLVRQRNLIAHPMLDLLGLTVVFGEPPTDKVDPEATDATAQLLRQRQRRPGIAGNHGDIYDNRDRGHSRLYVSRHPGMVATHYDEEAREAGLDRSLNTRLRFSAPTIGNASLAVTGGALWRSLPRLAMTTPGAMDGIARLYDANHLYVYPAHRDVGREHGDLMPAMTPYMIVSLGSSHSDRPFLTAMAHIFAAYRPAVKAQLVRSGLLASTTQMILRRGMEGAGSRQAYMSAVAHPSAFDPKRVRLRAMIRLANDMTPDVVPPMVRLRMIEEGFLGARNDLFADGLDETLFDTPGAIARFATGSAGRRRYLLSVEETVNPTDRPLQFHWRVLRGAPERVRITPLDQSGMRVAVEIRSPEQTGADSDRRVDIAVFADNGVHLSAPAFFTVAFPLAQQRSLHDDGMPAWIDYRVSADQYADPVLEPKRHWRDDYIYDDAGKLVGWIRTADEGQFTYDATGRRQPANPDAGRDTASARSLYRILRKNGVSTVEERLR